MFINSYDSIIYLNIVLFDLNPRKLRQLFIKRAFPIRIIMIMNAVIARSKIKKSIEEDLETRSHSSKEDIDSQITSIPSNRTLNIFD